MNNKNYKHGNLNIYVLSEKDIFNAIISYFKVYYALDIPYRIGGFFDEYYAEFTIKGVSFYLEYNIWFGTELKTQENLSTTEQNICTSVIDKLNIFLQNLSSA